MIKNKNLQCWLCRAIILFFTMVAGGFGVRLYTSWPEPNLEVVIGEENVLHDVPEYSEISIPLRVMNPTNASARVLGTNAC